MTDPLHVDETAAISLRGVCKYYGAVRAVDGVDLDVGYGELLQGAPPTRAELVARMRTLLPGVEAERVRGHRLPLSTGRPRQPDGRALVCGILPADTPWHRCAGGRIVANDLR